MANGVRLFGSMHTIESDTQFIFEKSLRIEKHTEYTDRTGDGHRIGKNAVCITG